MNRALIFGIPLLALGVASWAAWQVQQDKPGQQEAVMMMMPGELPALKPFFPTSEAERQLLDLLHEPLIRLDGQGRLAPGLADRWSWHQRVTCWFPDQEALQVIQLRLAAVPTETRQAWELEEVTAEGLSLVLRFARPGAPGVNEALQTITSESLLPLMFLRVDSTESTRAALEEYAQAPEHAENTVRLWFDDDGKCELVTTRPMLQARESLTAWFQKKGLPPLRITPLAEVAGLLEPVLEFQLNASRHSWPDGSPVTAADVKATVAYVASLGYPVPGREGFRHIQDISAPDSTTVRVTYRRSYGAALASWVDFPILSEGWLAAQANDPSLPVPGAGAWTLIRSAQRLTLMPRTSLEGAPRQSVHVITANSALQARVALAAGSLDVVWPGQDFVLRREPSLDFHPAPPRSRLLVLWNLRSPRLPGLAVRESLALAVDPDPLLADGAARPASPLFAPGLWYSPKEEPPVFDLSEARKKLEQAGWLKDVTGIAKKGGQSLEFELLVTTGNEQREKLGRLLSDQWSQLGAKVTVTLVEPRNLVPEYLAPGEFDAALIGLDYELAWDQTAFWHSGQIQSGLNFSRLEDAQLDQLLEALSGEFDTRELSVRARAVQDRLVSLQPILPLIGDLQEIGVRRERFPDIEAPNLQRPLTLRTLLRSAAQDSLQMRIPNE